MVALTLTETLDHAVSRRITIEVYGLGYVGFPLSVRLATAGLSVTGIDTDPARITRLQDMILLDTERAMRESFLTAIADERLHLSTTPQKSKYGRVGIVCVPTPIPNADTSSYVYVEAAVKNFLKVAKSGDVVIIESSVEVGTVDRIRHVINESGYNVGGDMGLAFCPERIDPQNIKWTLENIPRVIYCSDDTTHQIAAEVYSHVNNRRLLRVSSAKTAEVVKSFENAFRLVNISLVNELAILCDNLGISVREVIDSAATKPFGFMPFYPGAGAGGHCIPKDPVFLSKSARKFGYEFATISNALQTNSHMPRYVADRIDYTLKGMRLPKSVVVCGMSYKPDTEDMRDSPGFKVAARFVDMGYDTAIYDPFLDVNMMGKYLKENHITNAGFDIVSGLRSGASCLCICQHHSKIIPVLEGTYVRGVFPLIYDCQGRLRYNSNTATRLEGLGRLERAVPK